MTDATDPVELMRSTYTNGNGAVDEDVHESGDTAAAPAAWLIDAADLLDDLAKMIASYIAFPSEHARDAVALWIVHCHAIDASESTPRLALISPERGSGKTRVLEVVGLLVPTPMHAVNMSAAALYRVVADKAPTLLLDEADTYLGIATSKQHEDLRGLINAGHRRGAKVYRAEVAGKSVKTVEFPAFAACALAGMGDLPDTILDRSIIVAMKRRAPDEQIEPFRERLARPAAEHLRERLSEWADRHISQLRDAWPAMPDGITDRAADVWEPLIAIADEAGGDWPNRARAAAVALNAARAERDPSLGIRLLADCRQILNGHDRIRSEEIIARLVELDESPWGDLRGKPLDARGLARRLRKYDVRPGDVRFDDGVFKGYTREVFHDAWQRYLPAVADVADVAHRQPTRGADPAVPGLEDDEGYDLHKVLENKPNPVSLSGFREPQQAQQPLPGEPTPVLEAPL
jgi:Protein of unknown function (DUF3631)